MKFRKVISMREFRQGDVLSLEQANTINNAFACIQELKEHAKKQKTKKTDSIQKQNRIEEATI